MATVYPFQQQAGPRQGATTNNGPSRFFDQPFSAPHSVAPNHTFNLLRGFQRAGLETHLRQCEAAAREKFLLAVEALPDGYGCILRLCGDVLEKSETAAAGI
jgi:hypothetical protein